MFENDIQEILFSEEQLKQCVARLAAEIERDYAGKEILLIGILRGSFVFMADLCRAIHLPCTLDFMSVSSYGKGSVSSGRIQITKDLSEDIAGRHVIVIEDILDSVPETLPKSKRIKEVKSRIKEAFHVSGIIYPRWVQEAEWPVSPNGKPMRFVKQKRKKGKEYENMLYTLFYFEDVDTGEERIVEQFT